VFHVVKIYVGWWVLSTVRTEMMVLLHLVGWD